MKVSCTRENLFQGLAIASHLTTKNANLPVLQNVLIEAEGGTLRFTTTNLEMAVRCMVRGKVEEPGETTVPSKLFYDYVSLLPNETVAIDGVSSSLSVACGGYKTKMNTLPASEFPLVPEVQVTSSVQIPVAPLREALSRTLFAVSTNESRPELTGVLMQFETTEQGPAVTLASTDSYRLSEAVIKLEAPVQERTVIIPARTLSEVNRILSVFKDDVEAGPSIEMCLSDNQVVFKYSTVELVSRIIEGNYPPYRQIIPKTFQTTAVIDREDLVKAVKTASLFSKTGLFDVTLTFSQNGLMVRSVDAQRGENTASCPANVTGSDNTVTVNYRYLLDGLSACAGDHVFFEMIDAANACVVRPTEGKEYVYIVMPIKQ